MRLGNLAHTGRIIGAPHMDKTIGRGSCTAVQAIIIATILSAIVSASALAQKNTPPKAQPEELSRVEKVTRYYLQMYEKHLDSSDWITRTMAVISLARVDEPRFTTRLMKVLTEDKSKTVRVYAWEALHGRLASLTPEQRTEWEKAGLALGDKNALRGDLRLGLVGLMEAGGPTRENKAMFKRLFMNTNSMAPGDIRTLWAMGETLARWKSPNLVKGLINAMGNLDTAYRAELVLRGFRASVPNSTWSRDLGSQRMWAQTQKKWADWFVKAHLVETPPDKCGRYMGRSRFFDAGEKITNPNDPKWKADLELGKFRISQLDVGFAVDSTGSMENTIRWIQRDVGKMLRAFSMISREPQIGITLYRDKGDEYVVRNIPLSSSAKKLTAALSAATAKGGDDIPEAVYTALISLIKKQRWSKSESAKKVIVLIGDAPPHQKTMGQIEKLVTKSVENGFVFYCVKVRTAYTNHHGKRKNYDRSLSTFDKIAEWGKGKSMWVKFLSDAVSKDATARPISDNAAQRVILQEVLKEALPKGYQNRVNVFVNVLLEYVDVPLKEKRQPFGPPEPKQDDPNKRNGGQREPKKPKRDPQAR